MSRHQPNLTCISKRYLLTIGGQRNIPQPSRPSLRGIFSLVGACKTKIRYRTQR
ncbi:Uncharacterised protein [Vibrio cholerae]|nr:Uncharacterised protein [Vibrio cholerae]